MQNVIIPLDTKIDTDTVNITHTPEDIRLSKKNTIEYNGLLSNLTYSNGNGIPSTTGKELKLVNGQLLNTDIPSTTKAVKVVTDFTYSIKGEIVDTRIASDGVYTIIKDPMNGYHLFIDEDYCGKVVKQTTSYLSSHTIEEQTAFIERSGTTCYFVKSWLERTSTNSTRTAILKRLSVNRTTHTNNSTSYDTIVTKTFSIVTGTSGSDALGTYYKRYYMIGPINNAANNVYGADYEDMRKCWFKDDDNNVTKEFIGCVSDTGNVTGQPHFNCSSNQVYERDNGVLVFYPTTTTPATIITANKANVENMKATPTSTTDTPNQVGQIDIGSIYGAQAYNFYKKSNQTMNGPIWSWTGTLAGSSKYWVELDPTKSTGVAGPNAKVAHDCFPYIGQECNKLFNKGTLWDYGEGWATSVFQIRGVQQVGSSGTYYDPTLVVSSLALNKNFEIRNGNTTVSGTSHISQCTDVKGIESYNDTTVTTGLRPYRVNSEDETLANATVFTDKGRFITLNSTNINSGTQPTITYSIGGNLDNFVSLIPEQKVLWTDSDYDIYGLFYNGLLTSISINGTLLDTPSNGIEHIDIKKVGTTLMVLLDNKKYVINELGTDNVQISKVADFLYKTNLLCPTNFIYEDTKTISLIRGAIPFIGYTWNTNLLYNNMNILMPDVGNSANDTFEIASGMNVTLDSDIPVASYLLPAIQIPTYVASSDLDNVNKMLISERKMLVKPDLSVCYETDLIDVYFTHTLYSTDITYKTSFYGNGVETYSDKLKDTSWWITSDIVIFPIGISSEMLGVNYYAPTVKLGNNYTAQLYTNDNTTFAIFNSTQQVYEGNQIFTIYTNNYYYDGQAVYYIGGSNENVSNEFVCYALGMTFLCNSGTEAYFWSKWEKRLYVFTGSHTMQAADRFSIFGDLKDSLYSSHEQALYLLFEDDDKYILVCRTQKDNYKIEFTSTDDCYLLSSTKGAYVVLDDKAVSPSVSFILYRPADEANKLPLEIETEYIGDEGSLTKYGYADIQIYNHNKTVILNIKMTIRNGIEEKVETEKKTITPQMFKGTTYRCRVTPKNNIGTAFKLDVSSDDASISYMSIGMEQTGGLPGAPVQGRI